MNLQQESIDEHRQSLKLEVLMRRYIALARDAAAKQRNFLDFLENALAHERETTSSCTANAGTHGRVPRHQDAG